MKNQMNSIRLQFLLFFLAILSTGLTNAQMGADVDESSVLSSFKDKAIEWGKCPPFMPDGCRLSTLHGDLSQPNTDVLFKLEGKTDAPKHWHNSPERMILLSGELEVTYDGETTQSMKVGDYAYGPAKKPHFARCVSEEACVLFIALQNPLDAFEVTD